MEVADEAPGDDYITADERPQAGKLDVPAEEQPFGIEVVGQELMQDTGAKNIQDALLYSPGVHSGNFGFDTRGDSAKVRGLNPSFYVDGLRYLYGSYNSVRPNIYALESIEVLKGPSSVLYGQSELGGIINAVSKLPKPDRQGELWAQVGSYDRKQVAADITAAVGGRQGPVPVGRPQTGQRYPGGLCGRRRLSVRALNHLVAHRRHHHQPVAEQPAG